jgi:hypothetical protein
VYSVDLEKKRAGARISTYRQQSNGFSNVEKEVNFSVTTFSAVIIVASSLSNVTLSYSP